jgi:hypothetical protein
VKRDIKNDLRFNISHLESLLKKYLSFYYYLIFNIIYFFHNLNCKKSQKNLLHIYDKFISKNKIAKEFLYKKQLDTQQTVRDDKKRKLQVIIKIIIMIILLL